MSRHHRSAGLDQLGPKHYAGDGYVLVKNKSKSKKGGGGRKISIAARAGSSTTRRHVKVSLAKVPFADREDT
jgi:hypothetical protein